jgi:hypothetical protein
MKFINEISPQPKKIYESSKKHHDLHVGDSQLIEINPSKNIYVINLIAQKFLKNQNLGIDLQDLKNCLNKVAYVSKNLNATVHFPRLILLLFFLNFNFFLIRIGYGLPNFNWYGIERMIKKYLVNRSFIFYFLFFIFYKIFFF